MNRRRTPVMNIEQANRIPFARILEKLTSCPSKPSGHELVYSSPIREERTPSFYVNPQRTSRITAAVLGGVCGGKIDRILRLKPA